MKLDADKIKAAARARFANSNAPRALPANTVAALDAYLGAFVDAVNDQLTTIENTYQTKPEAGSRYLVVYED